MIVKGHARLRGQMPRIVLQSKEGGPFLPGENSKLPMPHGRGEIPPPPVTTHPPRPAEPWHPHSFSWLLSAVQGPPGWEERPCTSLVVLEAPLSPPDPPGGLVQQRSWTCLAWSGECPIPWNDGLLPRNWGSKSPSGFPHPSSWFLEDAVSLKLSGSNHSWAWGRQYSLVLGFF